jgi:hypothetical protein
VQNIKNYLPTKILRNARHIRFADRIPERFSGQVCPPAQNCPGLTSSSAAKSLAGLIRPLNRIPERFFRHVWHPVRHVRLLLIFRFPSLSDSLPRFQGVFPDMTGQLPRHARPSLAIKRLSLKTGLVRFSGRIPVRLAGHVLSPTRTSPGL